MSRMMKIRKTYGVTKLQSIEFRVLKNRYSGEFLPIFSLRLQGHKQPLKLFRKIEASWFEYCEPCMFRREKRCVGGELHLKRRDQYPEGMNLPMGRWPSSTIQYSCLAQMRGDFEFNTDMTENVIELVHLPDYVLTIVPALSSIFWFAQSPLKDDLKVIPFRLSNVYPYGAICFGNSLPNCRFNDSLEIFNAIMNMQFNSDLRIYPSKISLAEFASMISTDGLKVLIDYQKDHIGSAAEFKREIPYFLESHFDMDLDEEVYEKVLPFDGILEWDYESRSVKIHADL